MIITSDYLNKYKTSGGAWTRSQLEALGLETGKDGMPSKGWKKRVIGTEITSEDAKIFEARISAKRIPKEEKKRKKELANLEKIRAYKAKFGIIEELTHIQCTSILNDSKRRPTSRKPVKTKKQKRRERKKETFYDSREWRELRYKALKQYGRKCLCCGQQPPDVVLHVDHIKPRSKHPELELDLDNLQILCKDCNLGKSNKDSIDYRPK